MMVDLKTYTIANLVLCWEAEQYFPNFPNTIAVKQPKTPKYYYS